MKTWTHILLLLPLLVLWTGCATTEGTGHRPLSAETAPTSDGTEADAEAQGTQRLLIRSASITVVVSNPEEEAASVRQRVREMDGWIERDRIDREGRITMRVRIPEPQLEEFLDAIAGKGRVAARSLQASDVTDSYRDSQARVENLRTLRDRLLELLDEAKTLEETLRVERELSRVQGEIERLEAHLKRLDDQIALADVNVTIRQKRIYGPVGAVFYGLGWTVRKMFVIR